MFKEIVVHITPEETVVAVLEEHKLVEIYIERSLNQRLVGNIYRGKVANVLPGMQAAFIDIGLEKNAFLYVEDAFPGRVTGSEEEVDEPQQVRPNIGDLLREGQTITVQVIKEPFGTKGARVTTNITLPGRYLVLMPTLNYIGVSRRIEGESERNRLKAIAGELCRDGIGAIVRTVAAGANADELKEDFNSLYKLWQKIKNRPTGATPALIHRDLELLERVLRDILAEDINRILVNSKEAYQKTQEFAEIFAPYLKYKIVLKEADLLKEYNIPAQIEQALKRKVWLDCGGYIVIDQVEALTVIDVNTGKYVGGTTLADTVLKTNLEAAREIARQLRLRNIGGIVIIDFIDMNDNGHRELVLETLEQELKKDRTKTNVLGITQLGLVELTRKKSCQGLGSMLQKDCPYCQGKGKVLSEETVSLKAKRQILATAEYTQAPILLVEAHPKVAALLVGSGGELLNQLEQQTGKKIVVRGLSSIHLEEVKLTQVQNEEQLGELASPVKVGEILQVKVEEPLAANPRDGIARIDGYIINVTGGGAYIGVEIPVEITRVNRTSAKARLVNS